MLALGRKSFAEVCEKDADVSASTGERLVRIVAAMTREQALAMAQTKATAMVNLAAATPAEDTAAGLFRKKSVALPGGRKVSPRSASAEAIESSRRSRPSLGRGPDLRFERIPAAKVDLLKKAIGR